MPKIPFAYQWTISENELLLFKNSDNNECLYSATVNNIPEMDYYLKIFPNGHRDGCRGQTWIFLQFYFHNIKSVETKYTFAIESANYMKEIYYLHEKSKGGGKRICKTDEFFDAKNKYIIDGKFILKINGIFKLQIDIPSAIEQQKWYGGKFGNELWKKEDTKDFTIITKCGKKIEVHKFILANRSEVFNTEFDLKNEKIKRKKAEILDFSYIVVETALKLMYDCNFNTDLSVNELMALSQFFYKFDLPSLKAEIEPLLIAQISASSVCRLINCSILTNSENLKEKCFEFLMVAFKSKTALYNTAILDKDVALKILENSQTSEIDCNGAFDVVVEQKWEGGDLGDELWKHDETKDFTIIVDGKCLKVHKFILGIRSQMFNEISKIEESNETEAEIINFSFKIVQTGIKLIYNCNFTTKLSIDELMELLFFFEKFELPALKNKIESLLLEQISPSTTVRLTNCSVQTNSQQLQKKCTEFLLAAFTTKTPLADIKILDKNIAIKIFENFLFQDLEMRKL